jgi:hypothetical protein
VAPPPPGEYDLAVSVTFATDNMAFDGTARLVVEAPQVIEPAATPAATPGS